MPFTESRERLNVSMVKSQSRRLVFRQIFHHAPVTRADIAEQTRLSHGTVKTVMDEFLEAGIVKEEKDLSVQVGRKPYRVTLLREASTFAVVSIQPGRAEVHLLDLSLQPLATRRSFQLKRGAGFVQSLKRVFEALARHHEDGPPLSAIGLVVPGVYEEERDHIACHLLPELAELPITDLIRQFITVPIYIGEDVHLAAFAETSEPYGATQPMFYLYAGAGVGGSYLENGQVLYGATKMAGEIGQIPVADGTRLEERIQWPHLLKACGIAPSEDETSEIRMVLTRLTAGEPRALAAFREVVTDVAGALVAMVCLMNPRTIVVGGPYGAMGDRFLDPLRQRVKASLMPEHADGLVIQAARAGEHGMIRGAAVRSLELWLDSLFSRGETP